MHEMYIFSNFSFFLYFLFLFLFKGKKILSGGEREIDPDALYSRAADLKISGTDLGDWDSVCTYIEAFQ